MVWQDSHATIYTVRHGFFLEGLMLFECIHQEQLESFAWASHPTKKDYPVPFAAFRRSIS